MPTGDRRPLISGNWKMHHNHLEAIQVVQKLSYRFLPADYDAVDVSVHPPFTSLRSIQTLIDADNIPIALGAQNCYWEDSGAYTGEVSAPMLAKLNVSWVIVGHSERRELFGETDDFVGEKVRAAFGADLIPILCCGETDAEREAGETEQKVAQQVRAALGGLKPDVVRNAVVAYEPIWAIGTGKTATPDDAQATISYIRGALGELFSEEVAASIRILYGGSMKSGNAAALIGQPDIDGGLVGGASLEAAEFAAIVKAAK